MAKYLYTISPYNYIKEEFINLKRAGEAMRELALIPRSKGLIFMLSDVELSHITLDRIRRAYAVNDTKDDYLGRKGI